MPRINLSMDAQLFNLLQADADMHNCTVNVYLVSILEQIYKQNPFDYQAALKTLENEAKLQSKGIEFTLADLPSFSKISVVEAEKANLKPSIVRARLGKMFNQLVKEGKVGNVIRSKDKNGNLIFKSRTAVYKVKEK